MQCRSCAPDTAITRLHGCAQVKRHNGDVQNNFRTSSGEALQVLKDNFDGKV